MFINRKASHMMRGTKAPGIPARRGVALVVVMMVLTMAMAVAYSLSATQATLLMTSNNTLRKDLALQAAQAGAAVALEKMQSADWGGRSQVLARNLTSDTSGSSAYSVTYEEVTNSELGTGSEDAHLHLKIVSIGTWTSATDAEHQSEQRVEVIVRLAPRLPSNPNSETPNDLSPNPGDYDEIQQHTLFAEGGSNSLVLEPGERIDGRIWLKDRLRLYHDPSWSDTVLDACFDSVGRKWGRSTPASHPHPLAGHITFYDTPASSVTAELSRLNVSWTQTNQRLRIPSIDFSDWTSYRLYDGGPVYQAESVRNILYNTQLRPSESNPLGIFYRSGDIYLADNVIIQGTLLSSDTIYCYGNDISITSYDGTDSNHQALISAESAWPRLPALVAHRILFDRDNQTVIEGAIVAKDKIEGAGADFQYLYVNDVNIETTATSTPARQPWSTVQLPEGTDLSALDHHGKYAIWFPDGQSGSWYSIEWVNNATRQLTIVGELSLEQPTTCMITKNRSSYVDLRGPVAAENFDFYRPHVWADPSGYEWTQLYAAWQADNEAAADAAGVSAENSVIEFTDWLANPGNWHRFYWSSYYQKQYGLDVNDVVLHLSRPANRTFRWSPPLFTAYQGTTQTDTNAGYRWQVVSWRQVP